MNRSADFYTAHDGGVQCTLCPHDCRLNAGQISRCKVRSVESGKLIPLSYGMVSSGSVDPMEKKPLYHYYPGSQIFSVGSFGCNLTCPFCQNWQISQSFVTSKKISPRELIQMALKAKTSSIAYTYSEPVVWYEYVYDCSVLAHEAGLKNVLVTNGYINPEPLKQLLPFIDALNIDVKSFSDKTYRKYLNGTLAPVLKTVEDSLGVAHVELTTLVVTDMNDSMEEMKKLAMWIAELDKTIPLHISRYFPSYKYKQQPSDEAFINDLYTYAKTILSHVYVGNMQGTTETHNSYCSQCGELLIDRNGYSVKFGSLKDGVCVICGHQFEGETGGNI
ncbi:MAG: AmmeMemoRadiSam system radical SAM enzyme [Spirochaetes bacterium]|jgi:pyruvate formate lyase activating enzyme|nr:AmmeMemoRadiSam system radical SAM enzyme [Spirochaetota bacterium]